MRKTIVRSAIVSVFMATFALFPDFSAFGKDDVHLKGAVTIIDEFKTPGLEAEL